jgi:hypothetical protein
MKIQANRLCVQTSVWVLASAFCVTILTGCGANGNFTSGLGSDTSASGVSGTVHGGPNPVSNATVTLYATETTASPAAGNNYGYGVAGDVLGSTTTDGSGNFTLTGDASKCPAGQQAYIVAAGGNTGANAANSAALLMAALGPCSGISDSTHVVINEPTTIAAAYALSGFMTVSGTTVNISAPANNNGATGACTLTGKVTSACAAAGLAHAFLNAANLVNPTTGGANSTISSGSTITATVPQMVIYTLANSVEACINSSGAGSTPCTTLMTNTTPTQVSSPTAPTNTLQALLDLAQYPSEAAGATTAGTGTPPVGGPSASAATTALFNIANSNAYYAPALTAAPFDFTIAINYVLSPGGAAQAPWGIGTDIDDNVYVFAASTPGTIYSLTSNGAQNWETALGGTAAGGCGTFGTRCGVVPDTLGNVWVTDNAGLTQIAASGGALGTTFTTIDTLDDATVDIGNNVWATAYALGTAGGAQLTPSVLEELPQGQTTSPLVDIQVGGAVVTGSTPLKDPTFDTAGNLWAASDAAGGSGNGVLLMISSNNSLTAPSFSFTGTANPAIINGGAGSHTNSPMMDIGGNMWVGSEDELNEVMSFGSETSGATNYDTAMTLIYGGTSTPWDGGVERYSVMDGDGKILADAASGNFGYVVVYYPNAPSDGKGGTGLGGANVYLNPCFVASATTVCAETSEGSSQIVNASRGSAVDATGAIWTTLSSGKNVIQVLGPGAPSWSQTSYIPLAFQTNTSGRPY